MKKMICSLLSICVTLVVSGCDGEPSAPEDAVSETAAVDTSELKQALEEIAQSGMVTSGVSSAEATINQIADAAKKDSLLKKYNELMSASNPADIKKLAGEMAGEL